MYTLFKLGQTCIENCRKQAANMGLGRIQPHPTATPVCTSKPRRTLKHQVLKAKLGKIATFLLAIFSDRQNMKLVKLGGCFLSHSNMISKWWVNNIY